VNLNVLHRRLLQDVLEIGNTFPFVITGGYAVQAHGLVDRGYPRDLIDIHAATSLRSLAELESLGRLHARDEFSLEDLAARLDNAQWYEDEDFAAYGLTAEDIASLRRWAREWSDDIARRLYVDSFDYDELDEP
jgi:hypothetical protein